MKRLLKFSIIIFALAACGQFKKIKKLIPLQDNKKQVYGSEEYADAIVSKVTAKWFVGENINEKFILKQKQNEASAHMFYDVNPDYNSEKETINFVVTTAQGSEYSYGIDIATGQYYQDKKLCSQTDIWKKYRDKIYQAPFTAGLVPRLFDQLGDPQKIIIFGDEDFYTANFFNNYFEARVVGAYIEQICPYGNCTRPKMWLSRLVLVGVQPKHKKYMDVKNLDDLGKVVDWKEVRAFIENGQGKNNVAGKYFPGYRMGALVNSKKAVKFLGKHSITLKHKKLNQIRKSCFKLYDHIWENVAKESKYEEEIAKLKTKKERRDYRKKNPLKWNTFFYNRLKWGFKKYLSDYKTCIRYIYPSNINNDFERHWFFTYYSAIHHLHDLNYSFNCLRGSWDTNPIMSSGQKFVPLKDEFKVCNARDIDAAMSLATKFLDNLRTKGFASYQYLDYSRGKYGTHRKIYSWVKKTNKVLDCKDDERDPTMDLSFPDDVKWKARRIKSL